MSKDKQTEPMTFTESCRKVISMVDPQANSLMSKDNPPTIKILADWTRKACDLIDSQQQDLAAKDKRIAGIEAENQSKLRIIEQWSLRVNRLQKELSRIQEVFNRLMSITERESLGKQTIAYTVEIDEHTIVTTSDRGKLIDLIFDELKYQVVRGKYKLTKGGN